MMHGRKNIKSKKKNIKYITFDCVSCVFAEMNCAHVYRCDIVQREIV